MTLKSLARDVMQLFFPRYCWLCGRRLTIGEEHLCTACLLSIPRTGFHLKPGNIMERRFWGIDPIVKCSSYFFYQREATSSLLLYHLKYYNHPWLGEFLGRCMAQEILTTSNFFDEVDMIVPVPLHPKKEKQRGYNQCHYISMGVSSATGIPIREALVQRTRANDSQTHLSITERMSNVKDLFKVKMSVDLVGKTILIVDDVCTTGATILAVMDAFHSIPDVRFQVLTLAVATVDELV